MKRMTATVLFLTALSAPALAETPSQREMHSWSYVQSVANPAPVTQEAPMVVHHESRPYYHHESNHHMGSGHMHHHKHSGKHHGKKTGGKKAHHKGKHHHHHHTMKSTKATDASGSGTASPAETK